MASARQSKEAFATALAAITPLIETIGELGPIPDAFWSDAYAIGYLAGVGGAAIEEATSGELSEKASSDATFRAIAHLAGRDHRAMMAFIVDGDEAVREDFEDGFGGAMLVASFTWGDPDAEKEDIVKEARAFVEANAEELKAEGADPDEQVLLVLEEMLFFGHVADEYFPEEGEAPGA
ncbi:MAG: hypothetical protein KIT16_03035 [Rhodospirillaceae bacterium]|nr:hypothetical protein [Rhodospirillaceae bacterium]